VAERRSPVELVDAARTGDRAALARVLSLIERGNDDARAVSAALCKRSAEAVAASEDPAATAQSYTVGMTGAPGAGKSTLTSALLGVMRASGVPVAVLAVDPSSPYSGGAILGDRVRMGDHALDEGVFVRSRATRGHLGGLAVATPEAVRMLAAAGYPWVLVETVGVGQIEVEVAGHADTTVVVVNPGWGDEVQAAKAGLMEIADIFVVNKADRPGADRLARDVRTMLHLRAGAALRNVPAHHGVDLSRAGKRTAAADGGGADGGAADRGAADRGAADRGAGDRGEKPADDWEIPVLQTVAETGQGVSELVDALAAHRQWLADSGELARRRQQRRVERVREVVERELRRIAWHDRRGTELLESLRPALERGETTPYDAARRIVAALTG
jgi:LAO/AO transport system kinase